jgi:hypothetical protein
MSEFEFFNQDAVSLEHHSIAGINRDAAAAIFSCALGKALSERVRT